MAEPRLPRARSRRARSRRAWWWLAACAAGSAGVAAAAGAGLWFMPFAAGVAAGLAAPYAGWTVRSALAAAEVMGLAGWGGPLLWLGLRGEPVIATARVVAALAGLPARAAIAIAATLLVACAQAAAGLWLGHAVMLAARPR
ncbi:MAG TPA: hypothetical protein VKV80_16510 [Streptosporangiaceae bacterium]|nr:hypothetical protein [Streptosporangiaceae bacterium]